jgi:hypothetical protein
MNEFDNLKVRAKMFKILNSIVFFLVGTFFVSILSSFISANNFNKKTIITCDSIPPLNKEIISFVKTKINKKVGRGECWDLAAEALNTVQANWDKDFKFGKLVNPKTECVFAGDIIQFEEVKIKYEKNGSFYSETMMQHTAIIYTVNEQENFIIAEQNTSRLGKKVGFSDLELKNIVKGKVKIYRPIK